MSHIGDAVAVRVSDRADERERALARAANPVETTYHVVRLLLGALGALLPPWLVTLVDVEKIQAAVAPPGVRVLVAGPFKVLGSISAYYYSNERDVLVGVLVAVGAILIAYKGFNRREDWALNIAGALVVLVALDPIEPPLLRENQSLAFTATPHPTVHTVSAVGFFVALALSVLFGAQSSLSAAEERRRHRYRRTYQLLSAAMIVVPLTALLFALQSGMFRDFRVFGAEATAIMVFSVYWFVKTFEIHKTRRRMRR